MSTFDFILQTAFEKVYNWTHKKKQVLWIGEDKMLESAGLLEKKNSVCQKLPQRKAHVRAVCNFCMDNLSVCRLQESMLVQVKWLKDRPLCSFSNMNLTGLQLFLHPLEPRNSLGWVNNFPRLCSYNWKHWGIRYTEA